MRQGDMVYFITKGVVRSGVLVNQNNGKAVIRYQKGSYQKLYHYKLCQVAVEIEGGTNGRLSERSYSESNKRCDKKPVKYPSAERPTARDKRQAMAFLLGRGEYEIWLKFWCMLAGIDYGSVVKFGEKLKKGGENVKQI